MQASTVDTQEKTTSCRCHFCGNGSCNVLVHSVGNDITKVVRDPNWNNSIPDECQRLMHEGRAAIQYHYHPDRLNFPLKRVGERGQGRWERIGWDQALKEVGAKLNQIRDESGPEALFGVTGTAHYGDSLFVKSKFLNLFGTPNNVGNEQICHGPMTKAFECTVGWAYINKLAGEACKVFATNSNHRESHPTTWQKIKALKEAGSILISIDPRFTDTARLADYHIQLRPGSDGALFMAWMHVIINEDLYDHQFVDNWTVGFEELRAAVQEWTPEKAAEICWVRPELIRETARVFATVRPGFIMGYQSYDGQAPNGFRTNRACAMLNLLIGAIDKSCPIQGPLSGNSFVDDYWEERNDLLPDSIRPKQIGGERFSILGYPGWQMLGEYQQKRFGSQMYTHWSNQAHGPLVWRQCISGDPYPLRAMIASGAGVFTKFPNTKLILEAIQHLDLVVVADMFPNPLTAMADYVFPMSDWMERPIAETYDASLVGMLPAGLNAVEPIYERRSDYDFYRGLGIECGQAEYWPEDNIPAMLDRRLAPAGITFEELATTTKCLTEPIEYMKYAKKNPATGAPFGFATPSGKAEFKSGVLEKLGFDPLVHFEEPNFSPYSCDAEYLEKYPVILIAGNRAQPFYHSEFRQIPAMRDLHPDPIVEVNNQMGQQMDPPLRDGDWAWIETHVGRVKMKVRLTTALTPGVVAAERNWWFPEEDEKYPNLYGAFKSNINMILDDDPDKCGQEMGNYTCRNALCRIYRA